jgi:hypothetical protein
MDILEFCRSNSAQVPDEIKDEYFPNGGYDSKKDAFFDRLRELEHPIVFPFDSEFLFQRANYVKVVQVLPEFLASLFNLGFDKVTTFIEYKEQIDKKNILVSTKNLRIVSEVLWESHLLLHSLISSGYTDRALKDKILDNLQLLNFRKIHYDIVGCFQTIHTSFVLMLDIPGDSPTREIAVCIPQDHRKSDLLQKLVGKDSTPLRVLQKRRNNDSVDLNSLRIQIIEEYAKLNDLILPQSYEVNQIDMVNSYDQIKDTALKYSKMVDRLTLILPDDQTTDQSPVILEFNSKGEKIADIKLSHMEAAFLYYLGSEREAGESYWLHAPNERRELLRKIWNSFALPQTFEDELELDAPKKDSTTWIWDYRNANRKTLRNQIQRKIKYLQSPAMDFNLIISIKSKSPSRGGNYKLNPLIKSFKIKTPL